jgi:hypothetical protein
MPKRSTAKTKAADSTANLGFEANKVSLELVTWLVIQKDNL